MDSVFIGCNGKATTLGRPQTFTLGASAQISTEIDPSGSGAPLPPPRDYKSQPGSGLLVSWFLVGVRVKRISDTVLVVELCAVGKKSS